MHRPKVQHYGPLQSLGRMMIGLLAVTMINIIFLGSLLYLLYSAWVK